MTRHRVRSGLILLGCCALTALVTRWVVLDAVRADYGQAGEFYRYRGAFVEFLRTRPLADGEQVSGDRLPPGLRDIGVVRVYRVGRRVHFVLPPTTVLTDDAPPEFVHNLDRTGGVVDEVFRTSDRYTYHIQPLLGAPHWYYWVHN